MVSNHSFNAFRTADCCVKLYTALYVYDCLITIDQEVNNIWLKKWTLSTRGVARDVASKLLDEQWSVADSANEEGARDVMSLLGMSSESE